MTTHVPEGTSDGAVQDVRTREAARTSQLAAEGHVLRLWRPPLRPGEWRTIGLFAAADGTDLEEVLASMPLRVWRTDEVTPLSPHPDDPARAAEKTRTGQPDAAGGEFLTAFTLVVPGDASPQTVDDTIRRQADRERELAGEGNLERLWIRPGEGRTLGLWRAPDPATMDAVLASLPMQGWMDVQTTPLTPHPSDPGRTSE
jgi:muconolactone delta-isomerase